MLAAAVLPRARRWLELDDPILKKDHFLASSRAWISTASPPRGAVNAHSANPRILTVGGLMTVEARLSGSWEGPLLAFYDAVT